MKQKKYRELVDRWIAFYEFKFKQNYLNEIQKILVKAEKDKQKYGFLTVNKQAEYAALLIIANRPEDK